MVYRYGYIRKNIKTWTESCQIHENRFLWLGRKEAKTRRKTKKTKTLPVLFYFKFKMLTG